MASQKNLLPEQNEEEMLQKLLQAANMEGLKNLNFQPQANDMMQTVTPKPGFCLKTKTSNSDEKVFINVCHTECLPTAVPVSDEELWKILETMDGTAADYRIPMSLGEPHAEVDKGGRGCAVYDVIVHPSVLDRCKESDVFQGFMLTIILEGLEYKYTMDLDRNWTILKNRKSMGTIQPQNVRKQSKPRIVEMDNQSFVPGITPRTGAVKPLISETTEDKESALRRIPEPKYTIVQDPPSGHPEYLVAEIALPDVKLASALSLDIGEDRILLETRSMAYRLDIYLPHNLLQDDVGAQFNKNTRVLTITMPVQPLLPVT